MPGRDTFRALSRAEVRLTARLLSHDAGWEQPVRVVELGLGGARLELSDNVEAGSSVQLLIVTPNRWDPVALDGRVAWVGRAATDEPARAGMQFEHSSPSGLRALVDLLGADAYE
jgi:Tfp pilus assembly protein PilZ